MRGPLRPMLLVALWACGDAAPSRDGDSASSSAGAGGAASTATSVATSTTTSSSGGGGEGGSGGVPYDCPLGEGEPERIVDISSDFLHTIALSSHGRIYCWGDDWYLGGFGCMGVASHGFARTPLLLPEVPCIAALADGHDQVVVTHDGRVLSWGSEQLSEFGDGPGESAPSWLPSEALLPGPAVSVARGTYAVWARLDDGSTWGWGDRWPELWFDDPEPYDGPTGVVRQELVCDLRADGSAHCMGENRFGTVGDGTTEERRELVPVATEEQFSSLTSDGGGVFGITLAGEVVAWGTNYSGALGIGEEKEAVFPPTRLRELTDIVAIEVGTNGQCALALDGGVWCWGGDAALMNDDIGPLWSPLFVPDLGPAVQVARGFSHICSLKTDDTVWCRGPYHYRGIEGDPPEDGSATRVVFPFEDAP